MMLAAKARANPVILILPMLTFATGCFPGSLLGISGDSHSGPYTPDYSRPAPAHRADVPCGDTDPQNLCVALNYVVYQDSAGQPYVSRGRALANVQELNGTWSQCRLQFHMENFTAADPRSYGLDEQPSTSDSLTPVRTTFADKNRLTVVTTGQWTGALRAQGPNAWTGMPPVPPFGAVLEAPVGTIANLIAHELGHYLNLPHVTDPYNVMNPVVYGNSINITDQQCAEARATAISFWGAMLR